MEIPKDKILDLLHQQGKSDQAEQAEHERPDQVDPERHSGVLEKFGLKPQACSPSSLATSPACRSQTQALLAGH